METHKDQKRNEESETKSRHVYPSKGSRRASFAIYYCAIRTAGRAGGHKWCSSSGRTFQWMKVTVMLCELGRLWKQLVRHASQDHLLLSRG